MSGLSPEKNPNCTRARYWRCNFWEHEHREVQRPKTSRFFITALRKDTRITMRKSVLLLALVASISLGVGAQEMKHDQMDHSMQKAATVKGWISDSECAAHGVKNCSNKEHVANGAKLVVVTDKGGEIYTVTNPDTVADHQGHHVKVDGELDESAKTLTVAKVKMLK